MSEWSKLDWFVIGITIGYFWHPAWTVFEKVFHEAKVAKNEWRKSKDNDQHGV
jgi:hypothetical protein